MIKNILLQAIEGDILIGLATNLYENRPDIKLVEVDFLHKKTNLAVKTIWQKIAKQYVKTMSIKNIMGGNMRKNKENDLSFGQMFQCSLE